MSGTQFTVHPVQFGEAVEDKTGHLTISPDFHVYFAMEVIDDSGIAKSATVTIPPNDAKDLARMLDDSARRARHMQFTAEKAQRKAQKKEQS